MNVLNIVIHKHPDLWNANANILPWQSRSPGLGWDMLNRRIRENRQSFNSLHEGIEQCAHH
jgi:hypothetical protein